MALCRLLTDRRVLGGRYCWAQQPQVLKIRASLKRRGYSVWIDVEQMQGSTVDAMADAVDESYCIAYALSRECNAAMLSRFHRL